MLSPPRPLAINKARHISASRSAVAFSAFSATSAAAARATVGLAGLGAAAAVAGLPECAGLVRVVVGQARSGQTTKTPLSLVLEPERKIQPLS